MFFFLEAGVTMSLLFFGKGQWSWRYISGLSFLCSEIGRAFHS